MSQSALALEFTPVRTVRTVTLATPVAPPAPWVGTAVAPSWLLWSSRLDALLDASCTELGRRGRRARRVTVSLRFADGRVRRRTLALPHATSEANDIRPAALGLLRLLVDGHPDGVSRVGIQLGRLVEGANQPIRFERYLARRQSPMQRLLRHCAGFLRGR